MYFKDIVGLDEVKSHLIADARSGHVAHAQLFHGFEGSGVAAVALAYARYLNCLHPGEHDACGKCSSCLKYDRLAHPDLIFLYPYIKGSNTFVDDYLPQWRELLAGNVYFNRADWQDAIGAGNSQPIIYSHESKMLDDKLSYKVSEARYRIIYIWQPERMHEALANKMLKLVEEPPENTIILMASLDPNKIIGTIMSRVQPIHIRPLSDAEIMHGIRMRGLMPAVGSEQMQVWAHLARGNFRQVMDLIAGNAEAQESFGYIREILNGVMRPSPIEMRRLAECIAGLGREVQVRLLMQLAAFFRECMVLPMEQWQLTYLRPEQTDLAQTIRGAVTPQNVSALIDECNLAIRHVQQNVNGKMIFMDLILRLTSQLTPSYRSLGLRQ